MKELKSRKMRSLLASGMRKAKRMRPPSEGTMASLIYQTDKNGWHYQVEYINDSRMDPEKRVTVYAFAPPLRWHARSATHYLTAAVGE